MTKTLKAISPSDNWFKSTSLDSIWKCSGHGTPSNNKLFKTTDLDVCIYSIF